MKMICRIRLSSDRTFALWQFWAIMTLIYCLTVTLTEFFDTPITDGYSFVTAAMQYAIVCFFTAGLFAFIISNRWLFAITFPPIAIVSVVMVYFHLAIGIRLTPVAIEVALINDASMWWTMISLRLMAVVAFAITFSVAMVFVRFKKVRQSKKMSLAFGCVGIVIVLMPTCFVERMKMPVGSRLPYAIYQSSKDYLKNRSSLSEIRTTFDSVEMIVPDICPDVYLIIGEALRSDHLSTNGYHRNTMPMMSRDTMFVSYPHTISKYNYTDESVPHILTRNKLETDDAACDEQSFISLFKRAGYRTAWFANQDVSRSYAYFAHEADTMFFCKVNGSFYSFTDKWFDEDMLTYVDEWRRSNNEASRFAVLHTIGSHWWYPSHFNENQTLFKPIITHKDIGGLGTEELINSYDNTIIATDQFLYDFTRMIKDDCAIMMYVSDHGENLGEDGCFLHVVETDALHHPAIMWWWTEEYQKRYPEIVKSIKAGAVREQDIDNTFKTILDIAGIETPATEGLKSMLKLLHD